MLQHRSRPLLGTALAITVATGVIATAHAADPTRTLASGVQVADRLDAADTVSVMGRHEGRHIDRWGFKAAAGRTVTVTVQAEGFEPVVDVYGETSDFFRSSDEAPATGNTVTVRFQAPQAGDYGISVSSLGTAKTGSYRITMTGG